VLSSRGQGRGVSRFTCGNGGTGASSDPSMIWSTAALFAVTLQGGALPYASPPPLARRSNSGWPPTRFLTNFAMFSKVKGCP